MATHAPPSGGPTLDSLAPIQTPGLLGAFLAGGAINPVGLGLFFTPFGWLSMPLFYGAASAYIALVLVNTTIALYRRGHHWARHRS